MLPSSQAQPSSKATKSKQPSRTAVGVAGASALLGGTLHLSNRLKKIDDELKEIMTFMQIPDTQDPQFVFSDRGGWPRGMATAVDNLPWGIISKISKKKSHRDNETR